MTPVTPDPKLRAALEPVWNEVREQRLLGRIQEARRTRAHGRRRLALLGAGGLTLAGVAAVLVFAFGLRSRTHPTAAVTPPSTGASRLVLADGSEALLASDGDVQIQEQTSTRVRLRQRGGTARYQVARNPAREFVVAAAGVIVRVRGTIFAVKILPEAVEVQVERGHVEVTDRSRTRDLVAGETLSVPVHPAEGNQEVAGPTPEAMPAPSSAPAASGEISARATTPARSSNRLSASALLARADDARAEGRPDDAAQTLETFVDTFPRDRRGPAALFTLGRVETTRGRIAAAASAFERCAAASPQGPLADDALAGAARSWDVVGVAERARADARAYLAAHPGGIHASAMRRLAAR